MFCPECGTDHHVADRAAEAAADREVTLAKIQADRDIKIAQITANSAAALAETENALEVAHAEGKVEGMETVIDSAAVGDGQAPELGEPGEPIVVESPAEPVAEPEPDLAPPVVDTSSSPSSRSSSNNWWAGYK
jgi:hypothetical protein